MKSFVLAYLFLRVGIKQSRQGGFAWETQIVSQFFFLCSETLVSIPPVKELTSHCGADKIHSSCWIPKGKTFFLMPCVGFAPKGTNYTKAHISNLQTFFSDQNSRLCSYSLDTHAGVNPGLGSGVGRRTYTKEVNRDHTLLLACTELNGSTGSSGGRNCCGHDEYAYSIPRPYATVVP